MLSQHNFVRLSEFVWEIPPTYRDDMRVPARLYADEELLNAALSDNSIVQLINTSTLPGIVQHAIAMPDIHQGYGFPIGGIVATRLPQGVISPGGVGYDINGLDGNGFLCPDWYVESHAADLRFHLSWCRSSDEPSEGEEDGARSRTT